MERRLLRGKLVHCVLSWQILFSLRIVLYRHQLALWSGSTDFHLFIYFCIKSILKHKSLDRNLRWLTYLLNAQQLIISVGRVAQIDWCFFVIGESGQAQLCMLGGRGGFWESDAAVLFRLRLLSPSCRELGDSPDRLWMLIKFSGSVPAL